MARILVIEDEERLARSLTVGLRDEGYVVDRAPDGEEGLWFANSGSHDAIILDLRIPKIGGLEVCGRIRAKGTKTPIIILTACDATQDVVAGLDAGADDYLTKPFQFAELVARLRALLRRGSAGTAAILRIADLELDTAARTARRGGREIPLSNLEFRLLEYLFLHAGTVISRVRLASALWDDELGPESNVLEVLVSNLRRKIDGPGMAPLIHTRRGAGYVLCAEH
ncbi:MAG: response regulator transcription factor [Planctomycetes bacterium]|nr:response regulator transcription factor [Planctomycetota bacterium]